MRLCTVSGCTRKHAAKGYCAMHYYRVKYTGEPGPNGTTRIRGQCSVEGCERIWHARKLCKVHYVRFLKNNTVLNINVNREKQNGN